LSFWADKAPSRDRSALFFKPNPAGLTRPPSVPGPGRVPITDWNGSYEPSGDFLGYGGSSRLADLLRLLLRTEVKKGIRPA
jgi:hypothetical protein